MNSLEKGDLTEVMVLAALLRAGKTVLKPVSNSGRYDLVVDNKDGTFSRIQCKSGTIKNGVVAFVTCSRGGQKGVRRHYRGEIDLFGVYCHDNDKVYLVPVGDVPITEAYLRISKPKANQPNIKWASIYELQGEARVEEPRSWEPEDGGRNTAP